MPIHYNLLRQEILQQARSKIVPKINRAIENNFNDKKDKLIDAFDNHDVTQELENGPEATSRFLSVGNLFSLLGFNAGERPTDALRKILKKDIYLDKSSKIEVKQNLIEIKKQVWMPTQDDIRRRAAEELPLEWTDRSWLDLIERGITGFPWFLSNLGNRNKRKLTFKSSRSGTGIETRANFDRGTVPPIKYMSELLNYFRSLITKK